MSKRIIIDYKTINLTYYESLYNCNQIISATEKLIKFCVFAYGKIRSSEIMVNKNVSLLVSKGKHNLNSLIYALKAGNEVSERENIII